MKRGRKPYSYETYAGAVHAWSWFAAARQARQIAEVRASRGDEAASIVTERATGRTWRITPESDLLILEPK